MRYIIIPLLIILYGWWGIASIIEFVKHPKYPDSPDSWAYAWVELSLFLLVVAGVILTVKYW